MDKSDIKLLYVEDDGNIRTIFESFFKRRVTEVFTATNGDEGFKLYQELKPDLVVTDIEMPICDGISLIKKIRKESENIPIIVTSAHSDKDYLMNMINLNVTRFVIKPIDKLNLKTVIADAIELINLRKSDIRQKEEINRYNEELEITVKNKVKELQNKETLLIEQSKRAQIGNMIGVVAHQWKQPLNIISLTNELLKMILDKDDIDKKDVFEQLDTITEQIKFMNTTLNDFKNFFSTKIQDQYFHIYSAISMIMVILKAKIKFNSIDISMKENQELMIYGNINEFKQVILNILNNSIENFEERKQRDSKIFIDIYEREDSVIVEFLDNGGGIKEDLLPKKLFEIDVTTKREGTGIGLNISKYIIEKNFNGEILAQNKNDGANFIIKIPKKKENIG